MSKTQPQARESEWYDEYYSRGIQGGLGAWYSALVPELQRVLTPQTKLVELGCGQGHILRYAVQHGWIRASNIWGMDQSRAAVDFVRSQLPEAHLSVGDIYRLDLPREFFDVCLLMETIEHLEDPIAGLAQVNSILKPGGTLYLSFPNFLHLPWLGVRVLSDLLNKPNWIVRQPVDHIYTVFHVIRLARKAGFVFQRAIGSTYAPPLLDRFETPWITTTLNSMRLWWLSFHPVLVFSKTPAKEA